MGNTKLANPAPLGLMGFGMTTILLNLANSGLFAFDVAILAMGIFYGGIAQIFAGLLEYKKRQHFWLNRFYLLRQLLADAGGDSSDAENGPGRRAKRALPRYVPRPVGRLYSVYVLWHPEGSPYAAVCLPEPDRTGSRCWRLAIWPITKAL